MPTHRLFAALLTTSLTFMAASAVLADETKSFTRSVSGSELALPKIPGFGDPDAIPLFRQRVIESGFRGARLLAFYPSEPDLSGASTPGRYIVVLTRRESAPPSGAGEIEKLKGILRESAIAAVRVDLPPGTDDTGVIAEMKRRFDAAQLRLVDGSELLLGVLDEQPRAVSLITVQKAAQAPAIAQAMTQVLVRGAWLNIYATSPYRSQQDVRWVVNVTRTWLAALEATTPE